MKCSACQHKNQKNAKFCANCGKSLEKSDFYSSKNKRSNKVTDQSEIKLKNKSQSQNTVILKTLLTTKSLYIAATIVLATFLIISIITKQDSRFIGKNQRFVDEKSENPIVETKVFDIASQFVCGCGKCGELPLDECKCDFAVDERQFIRDYIEKGDSEEDVVEAMISKYGGYKKGEN